MKTKTLQNLTKTSPAIKQLLKGQTITAEQLAALSKQEQALLANILSEQFNNATSPEERERLWALIEPNADTKTKSDYFEYNHRRITTELNNYLNENNTLPSKQKLSELTGLSRQTVYNHLKSYKQSPHFRFQQEALELLATNLVSKLYTFACQGNVQAAKLFFELTGTISPPNTTTTTTNYIQINNTIFSKESLSQLPAEQLAEVEKLLHKALSK